MAGATLIEEGPGTPRSLSPGWSGRLGTTSLLFAVGVALGLALHGRQVDIDVYLLGGAHASSPRLYSLSVYQLVFTYPPFAAVILTPLAQLHRTPAQVVWGLANVAGLLWLLYASLRAARPQTSGGEALRWGVLLLAPALLLNPVLETEYLGQVNIFIAALVVADLARGGDRRFKGVLTGIAAAVKLTPLLFVPWLFLTRQYRAACVALATFGACTALGCVISPTGSRIFWTRDVFEPARAGGMFSISDQNLKSALMRILHHPAPPEILFPLTIALACFGLWLAAWAYRSSSPMLGLLVCATTGLVVSPITWSHHLVWVIPAICWLALAPDRPRHGRKWAIVLTLFFWAGPIWWVPVADRGLHEKLWELVVGNSFLWVMLAGLVGVTLLLALRRLRCQEPLAPARIRPDDPSVRQALRISCRPTWSPDGAYRLVRW